MKRDDLTVDAVVHRDPEIMSGLPVFVGTRVPVQTLLDHLAESDGMEEFLENFPGVTRDQVTEFLKQAAEDLVGRPLWYD